MKKLLILPLLILFLTACISVPKGLEKDKFTIQNLKNIEKDDYHCACKKTRLGGKIVAVTALKDKTKVEIVSLQISHLSAKPILDSNTEGRFIAYLDGFIEPETLKEQYITIVGILKGTEIGKIDQKDYQYPVIDVTAYKQWRLKQEYYYDQWDWDDRRFGFGYRLFYQQPKLRYNLY